MTERSAQVTYLRFLYKLGREALSGGPRFCAWMTVIAAIALVGANAWAHQVESWLALRGMSDHVSWGLYIANFTFGVGLAAGAVMMVIPAYLYDDDEMHEVVLFGELLAIASVAVCLLFITVDLGRPDRFWHMLPGIGRFNWPMSMLGWDVIVLNGYLLLNLHVTGYLVYQRYLGQRPRTRWYLPFVLLSIGWAISSPTVTAFLYAGLGGRPFWNSALLAPRFIASAFVAGPAFVIGLVAALRRFSRFPVPDGPTQTLTRVLRVTLLVNLFMLGSELFTTLYTGGLHAAAARYLFLGEHGKHALVPWIWTALALEVAAIALLFVHARTERTLPLLLACAGAFAGVWIEKGMGLISPGFVPSTLHEVVEYVPSIVEWKVTAGIWAFGAMLLTVAVKQVVAVLTESVNVRSLPPPPRPAR